MVGILNRNIKNIPRVVVFCNILLFHQQSYKSVFEWHTWHSQSHRLRLIDQHHRLDMTSTRGSMPIQAAEKLTKNSKITNNFLPTTVQPDYRQIILNAHTKPTSFIFNLFCRTTRFRIKFPASQPIAHWLACGRRLKYVTPALSMQLNLLKMQINLLKTALRFL